MLAKENPKEEREKKILSLWLQLSKLVTLLTAADDDEQPSSVELICRQR